MVAAANCWWGPQKELSPRPAWPGFPRNMTLYCTVRGKEGQAFANLASSFTESHFCHILFFGSESLWPLLYKEKKIRIHLLVGEVSKSLQKCFETITAASVVSAHAGDIHFPFGAPSRK